ncbi:MAG: pyruvate kinase [Thermoplasmataceae archaeon]
MPKTKIIATIGPRSQDESVLKQMISYGLSCVRINTAHADVGYIKTVKDLIDKLNVALKSNVGVMVDLKGPEIRTGEFKNHQFAVRKGTRYTLGPEGSDVDISLSHKEILDVAREKDTILLSDGAVRLKVTKVEKDRMTAESQDDGILRDRSRVNLPGKLIPVGNLTDRDRTFLKAGIDADVDFFAQSFVQNKESVLELEEAISGMGGDQFIVSKIETKSGFQNIREIAKVSDFIMVARGDLGVELPLKEVAIAQKKIIEEAHKEGVPTIVATQMLESMVKASSPTRAEVSDVTNAIMDNADALMLSEESAIGDHPVEAVSYLSEIAEFVESRQKNLAGPEEYLGNRVAFSIARSAKSIAEDIDADAILAFTKTGNTAKMISAVRPGVPIYAAVTSQRMANRLSLYRAVEPVVFSAEGTMGIDLLSALSFFEAHTPLRKGNRVVVTSGAPYFLFGGTTEVRVATIGSFVGRGYPSGKSIRGRLTRNPDEKREILLVEGQAQIPFEKIGKFQAVIFTNQISHRYAENLRGMGITILTNTKLASYVRDGEEVYLDGETGVLIL